MSKTNTIKTCGTRQTKRNLRISSIQPQDEVSTPPPQHNSLYYVLKLLRNVFIGNNELLLLIEIPKTSQSPIHNFLKGVPHPQPFTNSTTESVLELTRELLVVWEATTNFCEMDKKYRFSFVKVYIN